MKTPQFRLLVIRTTDIEQVLGFYESLGLDFIEHRHGTGPIHFATELSDLVFENYPTKKQENVDRMTQTDEAKGCFSMISTTRSWLVCRDLHSCDCGLFSVNRW
ncbi:MAG: hypothetical protein LW870_25135 [Pirellula sp.]|jgi:hypothetical protein|nr:hypothetical protein [Pirellula sp.]